MPQSGSNGPHLHSVEGEPRALGVKEGTLGQLKVSIHQNGSHVNPPTHRDLAADHPGSSWAALKPEGLPHCDLGCETLREEGTLV